jgi:hemerythrin
MPLITWDESLSVGVAVIDRQHQRLFDIINELDRAISKGKDNDAISQIIDDLIIYTATHFRTEEKYFTQLDYPGAEPHKQEHQIFTKKVGEMTEKFIRGPVSGRLALSIEVMRFLSKWWVDHILATDKQYAKLPAKKRLE